MSPIALAELEVEALEWEANVAGGQLALVAFVLLACIGGSALVTYVVEEVRHDPSRHSDTEEPHS